MNDNPKDFDELLRELKEVSVEILVEDELQSIIGNERVYAYIGFEPSNILHLGALVASEPLIRLAQHGVRIKFLLADVHAWLNGKGELEELGNLAELNKRLLKGICKARGIDLSLVEFVYGSDYQFKEDYIKSVLKLSKLVTAAKARKSMDMISKKDYAYKVSSEIYALMQVIDIGYLNVKIAVGGLDQRKIHVLAREYLEKCGYEKPVVIHTPIILGLDGKSKMSKSLENTILLTDDESSIQQKIWNAFCPEGQTQNNPLIDIVKYVVFPWRGYLEIENRRFEKFQEFESVWIRKEVPAPKLKEAMMFEISEILSRVLVNL
jgi:tyrosyl-tRNA synthetase